MSSYEVVYVSHCAQHSYGGGDLEVGCPELLVADDAALEQAVNLVE
jgi:hypothetical protein